MPEIEFYMNEQDEQRVTDFLLSSETWIVPDLRYKTAEYSVIRDLDTYLAVRRETMQFFVLHDDWITSPLEMHQYTWQHDGNKYYSVMPRNGGPTIDFEVCNRYEKRGRLYFASGSVSYYTWHWDTRLHERRKPPSSLKDTFKQIRALVMDGAQKIVTEKAKREYLVCSGAADEINSGRIKLGGVFETD